MPLEVWLPLLNTSLIVISGICLVIGFIFIKQQKIELHKAFMLTATTFAGLFLIVYVTRYLVLEETRFQHEGILQIIYFTILIVHIIMAIVIVPLVLITLRRALKEDFDKHKKIAKLTFPIWLFVAVSGWVVYYMLHHL